MLTPIEIHNRTFKSGIGFDKKDVEAFFKEVAVSYESLYKENVELNDKIGVLSEGIQYYKSIEKTLQKALVLAERTSDETKESAVLKAKAIEEEAHIKAKSVLVDAEHKLNEIHLKTMDLIRQYDMYKAQFKQLAATQIDFLNSDSFQIEFANLNIFSSNIEAEDTKSEMNPNINDKINKTDHDDSIKKYRNRNVSNASLDELLEEVIPKASNNTKSLQNNESNSQDDSFEYIEVED